MAKNSLIHFIRQRTKGLRIKRMNKFLQVMNPSKREVILDIGGRPGLWVKSGYKGKVVLANIEDPMNYKELPLNMEYIYADGRCLNFPDKSYDIVFSNSVIEHIGNFKDQKTFASECIRVGKRYWIQTPNKYFPIEPHFNFPFYQFLPIKMQKRIAVFWPLSFVEVEKKQSLEVMGNIVRSIRLLSIEEMKILFPSCIIWEERLFGIIKSIVAYMC